MAEYPTINIEVPAYGWKIKCWEINERESEEIARASEANDNDSVLKVIAGLIVEWNCTDRNGKELDKTVEGLKYIPKSVLEAIIGGLGSGKAGLDPN